MRPAPPSCALYARPTQCSLGSPTSNSRTRSPTPTAPVVLSSRPSHGSPICHSATPASSHCARSYWVVQALRVLACLNQYALLLNEAYAVSLMCDVRFVIMRIANYVKDWHIGAEGGADYWSRAEDFIERHRTGEINSLQYIIPE
ncbi:hypothetical protein B0H13DRAFT_2677050 [Mycena leptocephala]|nr:hypothetical protein B0H13DRAFT_2677050 [Mycena leptocephala]